MAFSCAGWAIVYIMTYITAIIYKFAHHDQRKAQMYLMFVYMTTQRCSNLCICSNALYTHIIDACFFILEHAIRYTKHVYRKARKKDPVAWVKTRMVT